MNNRTELIKSTLILILLGISTLLFAQKKKTDTIYVKDYAMRRALIKNNFTGVLITKDVSREAREEMKNGRHHGFYTSIKGDFVEEKHFFEGKRHGLWTKTEKGQLIQKDSFAYGNLQSSYKWDVNGLLLEKDELKTTGNYESYYSNGQLKLKMYRTKSGTLDQECYTKEGVLLQQIMNGDTMNAALDFTKDGLIGTSDFVSAKKSKVQVLTNELQARWGLGFIDQWYVWDAVEQGAFKLLSYDKPNGEINGQLHNDTKDNGFNVFYHRDGIRNILDEDGTGIAEYKTQFFIKFYTERNGYLRILYHSSPDEEVWVKKSEVEKFFKVISWVEFAARSEKALVVKNNYSLNVRSEPGVQYDKVYNIKKIDPDMDGSFLFMTPTGRVEGSWIEVKGYIGKGCDYNLITNNKEWEFTGWVKAVDDLGYPNVFRTYCGC